MNDGAFLFLLAVVVGVGILADFLLDKWAERNGASDRQFRAQWVRHLRTFAIVAGSWSFLVAMILAAFWPESVLALPALTVALVLFVAQGFLHVARILFGQNPGDAQRADRTPDAGPNSMVHP